MCQTCGCTPCEKCGDSIENGVCAGCSMASSECKCEDMKEEDAGMKEEENKESEE